MRAIRRAIVQTPREKILMPHQHAHQHAGPHVHAHTGTLLWGALAYLPVILFLTWTVRHARPSQPKKPAARNGTSPLRAGAKAPKRGRPSPGR